ncbi:hypothetical protein FHG87_025216, partial [Trinorchestia longiramus]
SWQLWENRGFDFSTSAVTCGHFVHLDCQENYHRNVRANPNLMLPDDIVLDSRYGDYLCAVCRGYTNATIPLTPSIRHWIHTGSVPQKSWMSCHTPQPPPPHEETKREDSVSQTPLVPRPESDPVHSYYIEQQQQSVAVDLSVDSVRDNTSQEGGGRTGAEQDGGERDSSEQDGGRANPKQEGNEQDAGADADSRHTDDREISRIQDDKERHENEANILEIKSPSVEPPSTGEQDPELTFDEAFRQVFTAEGVPAPFMVYRLLGTHDIEEYSGLTKYNLQTLYERLTGLPLSRVRHILDDSYNTCKLGYLNGCLRTHLESQLSAMGGLVHNGGCELKRGWDPSNLLTGTCCLSHGALGGVGVVCL